MSLYPCYVEDHDGRWIKDPVIGVKGEWFICWDEDDDIELVVKQNANPNEIIKGINFVIGAKISDNVTRAYGIGLAKSYGLKVRGPIKLEPLLRGKIHESKPNKVGTFFYQEKVQVAGSGR